MEKFTLLQDLVRSQNDQLLDIRRLVDETMILDAAEFNALSNKVKNELFSLTASSIKKIKRDLMIPTMYQKGELLVLQMECRRVGFNTDLHESLFEAAGLPVPGDISTESDVYSAPSSEQHDSLISESSRIPFPNDVVTSQVPSGPTYSAGSFRAYSLKTSPKKELKKARKEGVIKNCKGGIKIKREEFVIDMHGTRPGFEIVPLQKIGTKKKRYTLKPNNLNGRINKVEDVVVYSKSQYVYLGRIVAVSSRTLEAEEFQSLSPEIRGRVYEGTCNGQREANTQLERQYASGELKVARLDFECVGSNGDVEKFLEGLVTRGF